MAKTKQQKVEILEKIKDAIANAASVVFVNFHGLGVSEANNMRNALKEEGIRYFVSKKTLIRRALEDAKLPGDIPVLDGELAIAWGDDSIAPARGINTFATKYEGKLSILGGIFERRLIGKEEMLAIASIPPLKTLYGQFVNIINSPIQGFVMALGQIAEQKS
ncbi:50S ribosomal protein L10 [Candidatus Kaiserbacteria bacterium]|nr:50S ribosomal protein L10 [Candidatus Kaiserbacteria bacterium]